MDAAEGASTGEVLTAYLVEQVARLRHAETVRATGDPEGVHQMRVAARRLRSVLGTYEKILADRAAIRTVRAELRWLGAALGEARDAQVLMEELEGLLAAQPAELVLGPVRERIARELGGRQLTGSRDADAALADARYAQLLHRVDQLCTPAALSQAADRPARSQLPDLLKADLDRVRRRHRAVEEADTAEARDHALHEVRKAAKRLRYAAESAEPALGHRAGELARAAEQIQEVLGEHQDSTVTRTVLLEIAERAHREAESSFTYGRLHALEEARGVRTAGEYAELHARLPSGSLRSWLGR